jgi:transcriptional regulator with XRE-family HTH domain
MTLGDRLRSYRHLAGLTLKEVAHFTGISLSFLSDLEHGRSDPSLDTLRRLARFYNVSADLVLDGTEPVINDLASAIDPDDYALMVGEAGNLGGVELA